MNTKSKSSGQDAGMARLLTAGDAAFYLRLSIHTLNAKRSAGTGPIFLKLGGRVFYRPEDIERWILSRRATNTAQARNFDEAVS